MCNGESKYPKEDKDTKDDKDIRRAKLNANAQKRFREKRQDKMDEFQNQITKLEGEIKGLEGRLKEVEDENKDLEEEQRTNAERLAQVMTGLMANIESLRARIDGLDVSPMRMPEDLVVRIDSLDGAVRQLSSLIYFTTTSQRWG